MRVRLSDVATVGAGQSAPQELSAFVHDGRSFIRAGSLEDLSASGDMHALERISDTAAKEHGLKLYPKGTVVFAKSGMSATKNRIFVLPEQAYIVSHLATLEVSTQLDPAFLRYFWAHYQPSRLIQDTSYPSISLEAIGEVEIDLPPIYEQQYIAARLDKADRLRRLRQYALDLGETYLQSMFLEMFGDPVRNPKKWPIGELEELCADVIDCPHATPKYAPEPTPYACVRSSDIQNGYFDWSTTQYVAEREYIERIARTIPMPNDVVYCREGARFGNAARIPEGQLVCLGQRTMLFRADPDVATPEFIWAFLESKSTYKQAVSWAGGSASPHVNVQDIKAFHTVKPPLALQEKFAGMVRQYDRLRAQQRESLRQAEMLFGAMLEGSF